MVNITGSAKSVRHDYITRSLSHFFTTSCVSGCSHSATIPHICTVRREALWIYNHISENLLFDEQDESCYNFDTFGDKNSYRSVV